MYNQKKRKKAFLQVLLEVGTIFQACRATGTPRSTVYMWRDNDPEFAKQLEAGMYEGTEALIEEARRRAYQGVDEPVFYKGKKIDHVKRYSDPLLMFLIKGNRPEYRDKVTNEISTPPEGFNINLTNMTPEERRARIDELNAKRGSGTTPAPGTGSEGSGKTKS